MESGLINSDTNLRLRVFAGPNGSGKSTVIKSVRDYKMDGRPLSFGAYINADDIAKKLRESTFSFIDYGLEVRNVDFIEIAAASGMVGNEYDESAFKDSYTLKEGILKLKEENADERLAQIIADYLRKKLLSEKMRFSFETVFSHSSKLDIMRQAAENGYKVYLYFVSTESPEINKSRVLERKAKGGHNVPPDKIESRYYRSLDLLFEAAQIAYQAFFFDNSVDGVESNMFAHFKNIEGKKAWDKINEKNLPNWFKKYYLAKVK